MFRDEERYLILRHLVRRLSLTFSLPVLLVDSYRYSCDVWSLVDDRDVLGDLWGGHLIRMGRVGSRRSIRLISFQHHHQQ
jgi:hypothetical protein